MATTRFIHDRGLTARMTLVMFLLGALFVALVVPQICQRLVGSARPPLLASAVYGALLVTTADLIARTLLGVELPVGIVTAVIGAPYLLFLLARRNHEVTA